MDKYVADREKIQDDNVDDDDVIDVPDIPSKKSRNYIREKDMKVEINFYKNKCKELQKMCKSLEEKVTKINPESEENCEFALDKMYGFSFDRALQIDENDPSL